MFTLADLCRTLRAYVGGDASDTRSAAIRRAALAGIRELVHKENWKYYQALGRIVTSAEYSTGAVGYDHTGGANERQLTLADGTWPAWAASGTVVIANTPYDVSARVSDTILTLKAATNPGEDVDAGTEYRLYRSRYAMPSDFVASDQPIVSADGKALEYFAPRDWTLARNRSDGSGSPCEYTLIGDGAGRCEIALWPPPDAAYQLEFVYRRTPAEPTIEEVAAGKVTLVSSSASVTGTGTAWDQRHVGCVLRAGYDSQVPTAKDGTNAYAFESTVSAVGSATGLTLDDAATVSLSGVGYTLSSPIDIEDGPLWDFLVQICRKNLRIECRINLTSEELVAYERSERLAKSSNSGKVQQRLVAGQAVSPQGIGPRPYPRSGN